MSRLTHPVSGAALVALVAAAALATGQSAVGAKTPMPVDVPPAGGAAATGVGSHEVTLITGDVVTVTDDGTGPATASVEPARGNTGGTQIQTVGRDLYVVPDAALPYLAAGRLDRELFNVTGLIEQGYDDATVDAVPLIVRYKANLRTAPATPPYADRTVELESIDGAALSAEKQTAGEFWRSVAPGHVDSDGTARFANGIASINLDSKVSLSLTDSVPQVGAPEAWAAGLDGSGVDVAVLDTGIDATHPDLADRIIASESFVPGEDAVDVNGHGTHVASTIAGTGAASDGASKGVAPGAELVIGKVLDASGNGAESWIIDAMEWASDRAQVVNMSLGTYEPGDGKDEMSIALDELSASKGTLFVVAAGNYGRVSGIGSPGAADAALTVGAVDVDDQRAYFQDMGPRLGDGGVKPEIVGPGVDVMAARASASWGEGFYTSMSGTSMATPHVAGAAAILAQQHPEWTGDEIKQALVSTALPLEGQTAYQVGGGRLDIPSTAFGQIVATGTRSFGFFDWPHGGDAHVDRTITYTNLGDTDVALDLSTQITDDGLNPAPDGLVALSAEQVTVPAHGTATITVTATPDAAPGGGTYSGTVIASLGGEQVAQTAVGLVKEPERYDLDVTALDREGLPAGGYVTLYRYGDQFVTSLAIDPQTGTVPTQRLEPGIYNVTSWLPVSGELGNDSSGVALVGNPHLVLGADTTVVLDARQANRISMRTAKASEDTFRRFGYFNESGIDSPFSGFSNIYGVSADIDEMYAAPTGELPGEYDFVTRWRRTAPLLSLSAITRGEQQLTPLYQLGSTRLDGKARVAAVYAGTGSPGEYAAIDAEGKVVLVTRSDAVDAFTRAQAAFDAGARLLVVVNDGPGKLYEWAGGADVPVVSLTNAEGGPLIDRLLDGDRVTFRFRATEFPPYLYDLVESHQGGIPADLRYRPEQRDLAKVTNRFVGAEGEVAFETRADCRSWYWPPCLSVTEPIETGTTRVDYVSTAPGNDWYEQTYHAAGWEQRGSRRSYIAGQRETNSWFAPVVRPRVGEGYWHPYRNGEFFAVNVPFASSGDEGVTGHMDDASTVNTRLYEDGVLIDDSTFQAVQTSVPPTEGWADYRFEMDTTRPEAPWTRSLSTSTAWDFRAETNRPEALVDLPLLQLDYHIDSDLSGAVRAGRKQTIGIKAFHFDTVEGAGTVRGATLHLSFDDGATWRPVKLDRAGHGRWKARVVIPKHGADFVSLRATAWDDAGNEIEQEVVRAVSVR